jgi:hypothetical protein
MNDPVALPADAVAADAGAKVDKVAEADRQVADAVVLMAAGAAVSGVDRGAVALLALAAAILAAVSI